jgi:hypothetical protein
MKRPYAWAVHINHTEKVPPEQVAEVWSAACHRLNRLGIVALWVREPNKLGKVHYHLLVKNHVGEEALKSAIEKAMPSRKVVKWRKRVEPIENEFCYAHYMTKAKVAGYDRKGNRVADRYARKRLLFKASLGFKKYGVIGRFWEPGKTKEKLWDEIKEEEKRIAEGLDKPHVRRLVQYVNDLTDGYVPMKKLERSFGNYADDPVVQGWIEMLLAGVWGEEGGNNATR